MTTSDPPTCLFGIDRVTRTVVEYPVTKMTAKSIMYQHAGHCTAEQLGGPPVAEPPVGRASRSELDQYGAIKNISGAAYRWSRFLYLEPPALDGSADRDQDEARRLAKEKAAQLRHREKHREQLSRLRAAMANAHPDRGGSTDSFMRAQRRYLALRDLRHGAVLKSP